MVYLGLASLLLLSCGDGGDGGGGGDECNREGCDALQTRAADSNDSSRVAGIVAYLTDVINNGCHACGFAEDATIEAWSIDRPLTTQVEVDERTAEMPSATTMANAGSYSLELPAGTYLVCVARSCFNVNLLAMRTTTLNVRLVYGRARGYVGEPDTTSLSQVNALF